MVRSIALGGVVQPATIQTLHVTSQSSVESQHGRVQTPRGWMYDVLTSALVFISTHIDSDVSQCTEQPYFVITFEKDTCLVTN